MRNKIIGFGLFLATFAFIAAFLPTPGMPQGINVSGPFAGLGANTFTGTQTLQNITMCAACSIAGFGKGYVGWGSGANTFEILDSSAANGYYINAGTAAIGSGWGTSPALDSTAVMAVAGSINVGTGGTATSGTITYASSGAGKYYCIAQDATTPAKTTGCTATATAMTFTASAAWTASDHIVWHLFGGN